jgi:nuclear inhibitor of protein phosphatase 1
MSEKDKYELPDWVGRPANGCHLDVLKNEDLLQKLLIDEKGAYYFGRNPTLCDFVVEHGSCSRVHAVLLFHKLLKRFALVDLGSSHGTFVAGTRIEAFSPTFMDPNTIFHFGASTRRYKLRPKLFTGSQDGSDDLGMVPQDLDIDNLTEYNTAQNRRVPQIPITLEEARQKKKPRGNVLFLEDEDVINPEDVDPNVGRFRNLIQTAVIPANKRARSSSETESFLSDHPSAAKKRILRPGKDDASSSSRLSAPFSATLGSIALDAAPDVDLYGGGMPQPKAASTMKFGPHMPPTEKDDEPHKKKYAKEAWPGRKPPGVV